MKKKNFFKDMKIKTKLIAAFAFIAALVLAVSVISVIDVIDTSTRNDEIYNMIVDPLDAVSKATIKMEKIKVDGRNILLKKYDGDIDKSAQTMREDILESITLMTGYEKSIYIENYDIVKPMHDEFMQQINEYLNLVEKFFDLLRDEKSYEAAGDMTAATGKHFAAIDYLEGTLSPISEDCLTDLTNMSKLKLDKGRELTTQAIKNSKTTLFWLIVISVAGVCVAISFGLYFSLHISKPIMKCVELMNIATEGDFSLRFPDNYGAEIGELFNSCNMLNDFNKSSVTNMKTVIKQIRELSQDLLDISSYMASNSKGLSEQTSVVSTATEEFSAGMTQSSNSLSTASSHISAVASSIEEINSTISTVAAAAEETSTRVQQSSTLVDSIQTSISNASNSVNLVSDAFNRVAGSVDEINKSISLVSEHSLTAMDKMSDADEKAKGTNVIIQRLETASKQIGKIVSVISDIADQTNMLALNAAIEAAGAGEAGKGFMVVANEVKELAKQTADATDEIAEQIENMQKNMPEAVGAVSEIVVIINGMTEFMNSFTQEIAQQGKRSDQIADESAAAARRMNEITDEINRISENALSVTKTVVESSKGVNEIAKSTAELVIGSQEIAMNSERASNNISEINRAAKEMAAGLIDISKNIQLINDESGAVQDSADLTKRSSEELLKTASDLEEFISKFKID